MKIRSERNVKLIKEVDENYKIIEEEKKEHFRELLDKWKKLAKNKIDQYKVALSSLKAEKEDMQKRAQSTITDLQEKNKKLINDYEKLLDKYQSDTETEKKQSKEKADQMISEYEDEFSRLKQEKIELEDLFEERKSQKET